MDDSFTELVDNGTGDFDEGWISVRVVRDSTDWYFLAVALNTLHAWKSLFRLVADQPDQACA